MSRVQVELIKAIADLEDELSKPESSNMRLEFHVRKVQHLSKLAQ